MTDLTATTFDELDAFLFDLDGVLTPTAEVHMHAWARMFTDYFAGKGVLPYRDQDYFEHLDGKPRYAGVADLLASRGLNLPLGDPSDDPTAETVCGLGNRKNVVFTSILESDGVHPYPGSLAMISAALTAGKRIAVVSSSRNARPVLKAARLDQYFEVIVDGVLAAERGIPGKPNPDTYLYGAELVGVAPDRAVVVEDAPSGVAAGRAGHFGLVLGVDRGAGAQVLLDDGADVVVGDLAEVAGLVLPSSERGAQ